MSSVGCPVLQDNLYADLDGKLEVKIKKIVEQSSHQLLHAWKLKFNHPITGKVIDIEAPIPLEFAKVIEDLRRV
jgi:23S rRNA-/tRNA-specific pseudouridylate synthase